MGKELKVKPSLLLTLMYVIITICVIGASVCIVLGVCDFRSEAQKEADYRAELINNDLFDDAKDVIVYIKNHYPDINIDDIESMSCLGTVKTGDVRVAIVVRTENGGYYYFKITSEMKVAEDKMQTYTKFRVNYNNINSLSFEGKDLEILLEEVEK